MGSVPSIKAREILETYQLILLDAYGVLVTSGGALTGAREFIAELNRRGLPYFVLTNDASRLPETAAAFYQRLGLDIAVERIISAGMIIGDALADTRSRCFVFGGRDTKLMVEHAGHEVVEISARAEVDAVIFGDDSGYDVFAALGDALSAIHRQLRTGQPAPRLLAVNTDLLYPRGEDAFGFTSGAIALLLKAALEQMHGELSWNFEILGKPGRAMFERALNSAPGARAVMLGDQLHTDIKGAREAGIASVLVGSGMTRLPLSLDLDPDQRPDFTLSSLVF